MAGSPGGAGVRKEASDDSGDHIDDLCSQKSYEIDKTVGGGEVYERLSNVPKVPQCEARPLGWAWCLRVTDRRTHPLRPGLALFSGGSRLGSARGLVREVADPPGTPGLSPHHLDHPHPPGVREGRQRLARTQPGPSGRRPPFCTATVASPRSPPELARCPRPRRRTPTEAPSTPHLSGAWRVDWACSGARPRAVGAERMHSPGRGLAVQGRGAQAAALADALASLRRTRARMASLTAYDKDVSSASYNLSSATTGSYYSCVSQITIGYDVAGPVAIGLTHWKNPYVQGRPTLPSDLPLFLSKDAGIPVYHQSFARKADLATPLSCPASLSITPVPSYSSSSQETLSQDTSEPLTGPGHLLVKCMNEPVNPTLAQFSLASGYGFSRCRLSYLLLPAPGPLPPPAAGCPLGLYITAIAVYLHACYLHAVTAGKQRSHIYSRDPHVGRPLGCLGIAIVKFSSQEAVTRDYKRIHYGKTEVTESHRTIWCLDQEDDSELENEQ
ncbi:uncharacterized protein LOC118571267 [Onychomys torridus]|uniref:uncharacterized protein LOC118571267 n=1 Tax=Onychomys torridus TaxID=38674 RepID=UPI00167F816D|nr:uncharacterized protein LOC118571267 [Onychomys torridus]